MDALTEDKTYSLVCENETNSSLAILDVYVRQATLSWETPKKNTNGTALTDLVGYRIYWGSSSRISIILSTSMTLRRHRSFAS